eukprot:2076324-Prymnesium_polylepis.1
MTSRCAPPSPGSSSLCQPWSPSRSASASAVAAAATATAGGKCTACTHQVRAALALALTLTPEPGPACYMPKVELTAMPPQPPTHRTTHLRARARITLRPPRSRSLRDDTRP